MQIEQMIIIILLLIQLVMTIYYANYRGESYAGTTKMPKMDFIKNVNQPTRKPK
jgi:hypothetical protein